MAIIGTLPNNIQNGQAVDATPLMADLNFIVNQVNANATPLGTIASGALVNIQVITASGAYTPTTNATKAIVEGSGGGGAGGGAAATNSGQWAFGAGGSAGSYGRIFIASGLTTQTITIGAAGAGVSGAAGGNGGQSSFGGLMILPGGPGGAPGGVAALSTPNIFAAETAVAAAPSGSGLFLFSTTGGPGEASFEMPSTLIGGNGGKNPLGQNGSAVNGSAVSGYGAGGGGAANLINQAQKAGLNGGQGVFIVYEFA